MATPSPSLPPPLPRSSRPTKPPRQPESFGQFLREHRNARRAFEAFGDAQAAYYESLLEQPKCLFCGARHPDRTVRLVWVTTVSRAVYEERPAPHRALNAAVTVVGAIYGVPDALRVDIAFATDHRTCERCFHDWRTRGRRIASASGLALSLGVIGIFLAMVTLPSVLFGGGGGVPGIKASLKLGGTIALACGVIGIIMWQLTQRWSVPSAVRHICRGGRVRLGAATLLETPPS